jgi:ABC-type transport system substrate-binding protein
MDGNYWSRVLQRRINRRRALATTGAGTLATLFLAACGGDSTGSPTATTSSGSSSSGASASTGASGAGPTTAPTTAPAATVAPTPTGLLSMPEDTTAQAVKGGDYPTYRTDDAVTLDPISNTSSLSWDDMLHVYSHLTKAGLKSNQASAFEGDAAESWEIAPDGSKVTFKLRSNMLFDPRPPTNHRAMTAQDVKWSFDAFAGVSPYRGEIFNSESAAAPITSVEAPDDQTVVLNLAFPYGGIIEMVGYINYFYIVPVEADGGFDPRGDMRGSGPYRLKSWMPSIGFEYERNEDWYVKDRPFFDTVSKKIIQDYAAGLTQFETKNLWWFDLNQEDILRMKQDHPELVMLQQQEGELGSTNLRSTPYIAISKRADSPLSDVRVRQAASMLIDRDAWIETFYNTSEFEKAGLPVELLWHGHLPAGAPSWLDPKTSDIGEGQKYFQFDPESAKQLMSAAGQEGVELDYFYQNRPANASINEVLYSMLQEGGLFKLNPSQLDYATEWRQTCQYSAGEDYTGFCFDNSGAFNEEAYMVAKYTPEGKYAVSYLPIEGVTDAVLAARMELDPDARSEKIKAIEKKLAVDWYDIPMPGLSREFSLRWPWLKNQGVFNSGGPTAYDFAYFWYDKSQQT